MAYLRRDIEHQLGSASFVAAALERLDAMPASIAIDGQDRMAIDGIDQAVEVDRLRCAQCLFVDAHPDWRPPQASDQLARPAGFEPATRCLEGTFEPSRHVAYCRSTRHLTGKSPSGNGRAVADPGLVR